jgi:hypothetical protein
LDIEGQRKFAQLQLNTTELDKKADALQAQQDEINAETKELELKISQSEVNRANKTSQELNLTLI